MGALEDKGLTQETGKELHGYGTGISVRPQMFALTTHEGSEKNCTFERESTSDAKGGSRGFYGEGILGKRKGNFDRLEKGKICIHARP